VKRPDRLSPGKTQKPKGRPIGPPLSYDGRKLILTAYIVKSLFFDFFVTFVRARSAAAIDARKIRGMAHNSGFFS
jgi:hypothetical protein